MTRTKWIGAAVAAALVVAAAIWWSGDDAPAERSTAGSSPAGTTTRVATGSTASALVGTVTDGDGVGVPNAAVAIAPLGAAGLPRVIETDDDGGFAVEVAPGSYFVTGVADDFAPATEQVTIAAGDRVTVRLSLAPGGVAVAGRVRDFESGPIPGAVVTARAPAGGPVVAALADADGRYRLAVAPGRYDLSARAQGYAGDRRWIAAASEPLAVDFALFPAGRIEGVVQRRDGTPVPAVAVRAVPEAGFGGEVAPAQSGADGSFALTDLGPGTYMLRAVGERVGSLGETAVPVGIGETVDGVVVLVDDAFRVSGRVIDEASKEPVAGAVVIGYGQRGQQTPANSATDADGRFVIGGLPAGRLLVAVEPGPAVARPAAVEVEVGGDVDDLEIQVDRGATLSGRVEPAGPASISLRAPDDAVPLHQVAGVATAEARLTATADDDGSFELRGVPAGAWQLIASRGAEQGALDVAVEGRDQSGLVVRMEQRAQLCGTLVDTAGEPVAGGRVVLSPASLSRQPGATILRGLRYDLGGLDAVAGPDGRFCTDPVEPGRYLPFAVGDTGMLTWSRRHLSPTGQLQPVDLTAGTLDDFLFEVRASDGAITGSAVDENGAPAADLFITARLISGFGGDMTLPWTSDVSPELPAVTDVDGRFELTGLRPGTYELTARTVDGQAIAEPTRVATGGEVELRLVRAGKIVGRVTGATAHCTVSLRGRVSRAVTVAAPECAFELGRLPAGTYRVVAESAGGSATDEITVESGAAARVTLALAPVGSIRGRLVDASGRPAPGLPLLLVGKDADLTALAARVAGGLLPRSGADGRFVLESVSPGSYALAAFAHDRIAPLAVQPVEVIGGEAADLGDLEVTRDDG